MITDTLKRSSVLPFSDLRYDIPKLVGTGPEMAALMLV